MEESIIMTLVTAISTGGLTWLFTLRYTRKQAQADAMKSVQEVYQELITDMKKDRQELKASNEELKKRIDDVDNQYKEVLRKCNEMERAIKKNARIMDTMEPFLCGVKNCPHRQKITFETNN